MAAIEGRVPPTIPATLATCTSRKARVGAVRIGIIQNQALVAYPLIPALDLLTETIASEGGLLVGDVRRRVEFVLYDMKGNVELARTGANKLILKDKVCSICEGGYLGIHQRAVADVTDPMKVAFFGFVPGDWFKEYKWACLIGAVSTNSLVKSTLKLLNERIKPKSVAYFGMEISDAHEMIEPVKNRLDALGIANVYEDYHSSGERDFTSYLHKIKRAKPDMLLMNTETVSYIAIMRQITEIGGWGGIIPLGLTEHVSDKRVIQQPGAVGMYVPVLYAPGVTQHPGARAFENMWTEKCEANPEWARKYGDVPQVTNASIFVNAIAALKTIQMAGTDEPAAIASMARSGKVTFDSPHGLVNLGMDGDNGLKYSYCRVQTWVRL